jgi:hypothetical protein
MAGPVTRPIEGEGSMMRGEERLYSIRHDQGYFDAGMTADGRRVLMGLYCPYLVAIFFDSSGNLLGHEVRRLEFLQRSSVIVDGEPIEGMVGVYNIYDERIPPRIVAWQDEMGFRPATIRVKQFFLDDPEASDAEKDGVRESMRRWDAEGMFILYWGNDYWLDGTGEVESS